MKLTVLNQNTFLSILTPIPILSGTILSSMTSRVRERGEREIGERERDRRERERDRRERERGERERR